MPKISVVIVTYRRSTDLESILKAWLEQTDDVWLCDCGLNFKTSLPIKIVQFDPDPGNKVRHAVALLTDGDYIIKADDDFIPKPGFINDLLRYRQNDTILGIHGRIFHGPSYYRNTMAISANKISSPVEVDFVGICTFAAREYLAFDLKGCETSIEDLFWQMKCFPKVKKWVIPSKNYITLPTATDTECLFYNTKAREVREKFYKEFYLKNYK